MKREVNRSRNLPAFVLDVQDLGLLWTRCLALFDKPEQVSSMLTLKLQAETLKFSSFPELENFSALPDRITKLSLLLVQGGRHISLETESILGMQAQVTTGAESEAWCAGAVETVIAFVSNHRASYNWFVAAPLGWILLVLIYGLPLYMFVFKALFSPEYKAPPTFAYAWGSLAAAITILYLSRKRLFPAVVLRVRESRGFLKRNVAELGLGVAMVSLVLTVVGWFISK